MENLQLHQESRHEDHLSNPCTVHVCLCSCAFALRCVILHIFHSISSVDCTAMKLHVTVLMPLHVTHI